LADQGLGQAVLMRLRCARVSAPRSSFTGFRFETYLYRAIDQFSQVIDVLLAEKRDLAATRRFLTRALDHGRHPTEVNTDRAPAYPRVLDELLPAADPITEQYANNPG
jgi:transposase-like protein